MATLPGMDWGDVPGWVGGVLGAGALVVSGLAWRDGKRAAERANKAADRSAEASERSARAAEETLADQRAASAARVELVIERRGKGLRCLRNRGELTAQNVEIVNMPDTVIIRDPLPIGDLPMGGGWEFLVAGTLVSAAPASLLVRWDGQTEPVTLPVP